MRPHNLAGLLDKERVQQMMREFESPQPLSLQAAAADAGAPPMPPMVMAPPEGYAKFPAGSSVRDILSGRIGTVADKPAGEFGDIVFVTDADNNKTYPMRSDQLEPNPEAALLAPPAMPGPDALAAPAAGSEGLPPVPAESSALPAEAGKEGEEAVTASAKLKAGGVQKGGDHPDATDLNWTETPEAFTFTANPALQEELKAAVEAGTSQNALGDLFEPVFANSDIDWIQPEEVGALTSAPIFGHVERDDQGKLMTAGHVWWYPDYAVKDPITVLAETGTVTFAGAPENLKEKVAASLKTASAPAVRKDVNASAYAKVVASLDKVVPVELPKVIAILGGVPVYWDGLLANLRLDGFQVPVASRPKVKADLLRKQGKTPAEVKAELCGAGVTLAAAKSALVTAARILSAPLTKKPDMMPTAGMQWVWDEGEKAWVEQPAVTAAKIGAEYTGACAGCGQNVGSANITLAGRPGEKFCSQACVDKAYAEMSGKDKKKAAEISDRHTMSGAKESDEAREFISKEIGHLEKDKGYEPKRAAAAAYSVARKKGFKVPRKVKAEFFPGYPTKFAGGATYNLVWKGETIEEGLDEKEADYLLGEYNLAYGGGVQKIQAKKVAAEGGLDPMVQHYLVTALWSSNDNSNEQGGEPFDRNHNIEEFTPEAFEQAKKDCADFLQKAGDLVAGVDPGQVGHDFWLTRNGHGAGFWDRPEMYGSKENADKLTAIATSFGELNVDLSDDGKLYFM
jgi:hypothetical protein